MQRLSYQKTTKENEEEKKMNEYIMNTVDVLNGETGGTGYADAAKVNDMIQKGIMLYGSDFANKAKIYDSFVEPGKTASELTYERDQADRELALGEYTTSAKNSYYDKKKGLFNNRGENDILWDDFIGAYPDVAKDPVMAAKVRRELEAQGYTIK